MSDLLPAGLVLVCALAAAALVAAGRAARRTWTRRRPAAEVRWARIRRDAAARAAGTEVTVWLTGRDGTLRDAVVSLKEQLDLVRDRTPGAPTGTPDVADLDALAAGYDALRVLVVPVRDVVTRTREIQDHVADLDGAGEPLPPVLRRQVDDFAAAVDDAAARLCAAEPVTTSDLVTRATDAGARVEALARRGHGLAREVHALWRQRFPHRTCADGAALVDSWLDAARRRPDDGAPDDSSARSTPPRPPSGEPPLDPFPGGPW